MAEDWTKWDIQPGDTITSTRNNAHWQDMRQRFLNGEFHDIFDCRSCSYNERAGTTSPRTMNNKFYTEFLTIDIVNEVRQIVANNNQVKDGIHIVYPGLCPPYKIQFLVRHDMVENREVQELFKKIATPLKP